MAPGLLHPMEQETTKTRWRPRSNPFDAEALRLRTIEEPSRAIGRLTVEREHGN
jgi:hypothetical protein